MRGLFLLWLFLLGRVRGFGQKDTESHHDQTTPVQLELRLQKAALDVKGNHDPFVWVGKDTAKEAGGRTRELLAGFGSEGRGCLEVELAVETDSSHRA